MMVEMGTRERIGKLMQEYWVKVGFAYMKIYPWLHSIALIFSLLLLLPMHDTSCSHIFIKKKVLMNIA